MKNGGRQTDAPCAWKHLKVGKCAETKSRRSVTFPHGKGSTATTIADVIEKGELSSSVIKVLSCGTALSMIASTCHIWCEARRLLRKIKASAFTKVRSSVTCRVQIWESNYLLVVPPHRAPHHQDLQQALHSTEPSM